MGSHLRGSSHQMHRPMRYALITAARDEASLIEGTIRAVVGQTVRPVKWVVVSDGSTDGTDEIVRRWASKHDWIELVSLPKRAQRSFAGKACAIAAGIARVASLEFDAVANLDADTSFG